MRTYTICLEMRIQIKIRLNLPPHHFLFFVNLLQAVIFNKKCMKIIVVCSEPRLVLLCIYCFTSTNRNVSKIKSIIIKEIAVQSRRYDSQVCIIDELSARHGDTAFKFETLTYSKLVIVIN